MTGPFPSVILVKFPLGESTEEIAKAERELEVAVRSGIPSIMFSKFGRATKNDLGRGGFGVYVEEHQQKLTFSYLGGRKSALGMQLHVSINFFDATYSKMHAHDLAFLGNMLAPSSNTGGLVMIGQTARDRRALTIVSGFKGDVFAYLLGVRSGYLGAFFRNGDGPGQRAFPTIDLATFARPILGGDNVVSVTLWGSGRFLKKCFCQIDMADAGSDFENKFGREGRSWRNWNFHRIMKSVVVPSKLSRSDDR